ncbi:hypothetical protein B0T21DRAFT_182400 [Apiosordaria backusii]|uniref:Uncharacterized protein n=1 Tax=Apiosordaria backusii TaxID=314023 RepID=A0AA40BM05_9PEZI|nr:hypothetical protein B0T21DRAFT_182400 [Apiosordaria backusii]
MLLRIFLMFFVSSCAVLVGAFVLLCFQECVQCVQLTHSWHTPVVTLLCVTVTDTITALFIILINIFQLHIMLSLRAVLPPDPSHISSSECGWCCPGVSALRGGSSPLHH